ARFCERWDTSRKRKRRMALRRLRFRLVDSSRSQKRAAKRPLQPPVAKGGQNSSHSLSILLALAVPLTQDGGIVCLRGTARMTGNSPQGTSGPGERLLSLFWRGPAATLAERTRRRVSLHLIPYLFFLYILAYLDRVNVSVAQLAMQEPVGEGGMGFSPDIIGF